MANGLLGVLFASWQVVAGPVLVGRTADIGAANEGPLPLGLDQNAFVLRSLGDFCLSKFVCPTFGSINFKNLLTDKRIFMKKVL